MEGCGNLFEKGNEPPYCFPPLTGPRKEGGRKDCHVREPANPFRPLKIDVGHGSMGKAGGRGVK